MTVRQSPISTTRIVLRNGLASHRLVGLSEGSMSLTGRWACCLFLGVGMALAGCGVSENNVADRYPVTGKVTADGEPLASGRIYFEDLAKSISDFAEITNGSY